ncbi:MAG: DUF72 domain-containing protein [Gammaproteobacteria bacterium]|nr:DUF72 domain-containing protein [Gammaproteobacteria bacterium]
MKLWIGCSGYQYSAWKGTFYPDNIAQSKWFQYYAEQFNSVEINYTFYSFPRASTMEKWRIQAPEGFRYSLKAPRFITHYHQFTNTEQKVHDFYQLADILEDKLGCILFQFPAKTRYDPDLLNRILDQLNPRYKNVLEFRHPSWWKEEIYQALYKANISFCHLSAPVAFPDHHNPESQFYLRLHGTEGWYRGSHATEFQDWLSAIKASKAQEAWVYFNNTMKADAIHDAKHLQELVDELKGLSS